eukprot:scaffold8328_cov258-Pinguiococcus_pyrenoidosus.AAC.4
MLAARRIWQQVPLCPVLTFLLVLRQAPKTKVGVTVATRPCPPRVQRHVSTVPSEEMADLRRLPRVRGLRDVLYRRSSAGPRRSRGGHGAARAHGRVWLSGAAGCAAHASGRDGQYGGARIWRPARADSRQDGRAALRGQRAAFG